MNKIRVTAVILFYSIHLTHWFDALGIQYWGLDPKMKIAVNLQFVGTVSKLVALQPTVQLIPPHPVNTSPDIDLLPHSTR
jgi:hypothetical protein